MYACRTCKAEEQKHASWGPLYGVKSMMWLISVVVCLHYEPLVLSSVSADKAWQDSAPW